MSDAELMQSISEHLTPRSGRTMDHELTIGIDVPGEGSCVLAVAERNVFSRGESEMVDIDLRLSHRLLMAFLDRTIDAATLYQAIENGEITASQEVEPRKLLELLKTIDAIISPRSVASETAP